MVSVYLEISTCDILNSPDSSCKKKELIVLNADVVWTNGAALQSKYSTIHILCQTPASRLKCLETIGTTLEGLVICRSYDIDGLGGMCKVQGSIVWAYVCGWHSAKTFKTCLHACTGTWRAEDIYFPSPKGLAATRIRSSPLTYSPLLFSPRPQFPFIKHHIPTPVLRPPEPDFPKHTAIMSDDAGYFKKTSEAVANAGASAAGAISGSLSLGANVIHKKTTTTKTKTPVDASNQQPIMNGAGQPAQGRITSEGVGEQKRLTQSQSQSQSRSDALYEERMEDEYAKREGGA